MFEALLVMALGAVVLGGALGYAAVRFRVEGDPLVEKIDAILPQTQCGQCGYPGCKPYAQAVAKGEAEINQCPPGGEEGIHKLADLLGREFKPLSAEHGVEKPKAVALIDEQTCIGCTLCIQACPVDAIVGAAKQMHTVIAAQCTGCELCLPPCPVDCISMEPIAESVENWKWKYPVFKLTPAQEGSGMSALRKLFRFHGGVKPDYHKDASTRQPIAIAPIPAELVIPLHQSIGGPPRPLVQAGEKVLKGQRIGDADGNVSSAVHASTSGTVTAVEMRRMPHTSGLSALCVVIEPDGRDEWIARQPFDFRAPHRPQTRDYLRDAGVVGLGGAVFPSHLKLNAGKQGRLDTLVLNGAECEPFITCDDVLMRERGEAILKGGGHHARNAGGGTRTDRHRGQQARGDCRHVDGGACRRR
jgi:electron transport complex protein RnfB